MSSREALAPDKLEEVSGRSTKMARLGRKYAALFDLAGLPGAITEPSPPSEWASRVLRIMASASWADPCFLEELSESNLIRTMCRILPVLRANTTSHASVSTVQDLADLEEAFRKLRHELALVEKRLPNHGGLGSGGSAFYTTWASVGHACSLMLQALVHGAAMGQALTACAIPRASPPPADCTHTSTAQTPPPPIDPPAPGSETPPPGPSNLTSTASAPVNLSETSASELPEGQPGTSPGPAHATPAETASRSPPADAPGAPVGRTASSPLTSSRVTPFASGSGGSMPALVTEAALLKLLGNKHVLLHAKEVQRTIPESCRATLAKLLLTQIGTEMKATHAALTHILQVLKGVPAATSPAPPTLPKAWFATATLLSTYNEILRSTPYASITDHGGSNPGAQADGSEAAPSPSLALADPAAQSSRQTQAEATGSHGATTSQPPQAATDPSGDVEMADAQPRNAEHQELDGPSPSTPGNGTSQAADSSHACTSSGAPAAPPSSTSLPGAAESNTAQCGPSAASPAPSSAADQCSDSREPNDQRVTLGQLLEDVAAALSDAVAGAHAVGRMALLLRGEATTKFGTPSAYMPAALSINELISHLDALACVSTALGVGERVRPRISGLISSPAVKDLLSAGKVYVMTVIAAGALTRDLAIDVVIPQSLRQGYMTAVLTPLETGALLNERRAPQVLAYRNSITESSYYQVMDADALPYGVNVRFEDEQEAEGMGVVREWLSQIAADIFSPERGLFVRGAADRRVVHPSPQSRSQEDWLGYMRFAGRIVGLAIRANVPLGVVLSTGLYNYLTGRPATLQDVQQIDPQLYTTCQNILSSPDAEAMELFHVWHSQTGPSGEQQEQELLPGGASLRVTDDNKATYVELLAQHVVVTSVSEQCAAFLAGVQDTAHHLPEEPRLRRAFLTPLLLDDLNRITAGESNLDPADWAEHTDVAGFEGGEEHQSLDMFWQLVAEYSAGDRQRLLQFWTAMTHLPSGGFKALNQRLQIMKLGPGTVRQDGDGAVAAAAGAAAGGSLAAAAGGRGPSADGAGPHSHMLDGESLEADDQEPSEGLDEPGADAGEPQPPAAGVDPHDASAIHHDMAGPAAQPDDGSGAERQGAPLEPAGAAAAADTTAIGQNDAQEYDMPPADEVPYGDEEGDDQDDDGMGYGEEDDGEDEEFQRQLEMALALSLQDLPPPPPAADEQPGEARDEQQPAGSADVSAGAEMGTGAAGSGPAGAASEAATSAPADNTTDAADEPAPLPSEAAAEGAEAGNGSRNALTSDEPQPMQHSVAAATTGPSNSTNDANADTASGAGSVGAPEAPPNGSTYAALEGGGAQETNPPAAMPLLEASTAAVQAASADLADAAPAGTEVAPGSVATSQDRDVRMDSDPVSDSSSMDAASPTGASDHSAGLHAGGQATSGSSASEDAPPDEGPVPAPPEEGSKDTHTGDLVDNAEGHQRDSDVGAATMMSQDVTPAGADTDALTHHVQDLEEGLQHPQASDQQEEQRPLEGAAESDQHQPQQGQDSAELSAEDHPQREQRQPADGRAGDEMASAEGAGQIAAAEAPADATQVATRPLPLPQARTCFLQLNLPLYGNMDELRRAFAIALDNMSFGLH